MKPADSPSPPASMFGATFAKLGWSSFLAFLAMSPLIVYGVHTRLFNVRFSRICFAAAFVLYLFRNRIGSFTRSPRGGFQVIFCVTSLYAVMSGMWGGAHWQTRVFGWVECLLIYFTVTNFCSERASLERAVRFYFWSGTVVLLICAWQVVNFLSGNLGGSEIPLPSLAMIDFYDRLDSAGAFGVADNISRISGPFNDPNMLAGYATSLVCLGAILVSDQRRTPSFGAKLVTYVYIGMFLGVILLTFSKSGIASLSGGLIVLLVSGRSLRKFACILLVFSVASAVGVAVQFSEMTMLRIEAEDSGHVDTTMEALESMSGRSWGPLLFGGGFGGANEGASHRLLLTLLDAMGILGVLFWAAISFRPFSMYLESMKCAPESDARVTSACIAASCTCIVIGLNLYDYFMYPFVWIAFGFFDAFLRVEGESRLPKRDLGVV